MKLEGKARLLRIHFGEDDKWQNKPLYLAIVEKCRELDIAGATVLRGIEGYGASTRVRHSHHLSFSSDAPVMVNVSSGRVDGGDDYAGARRRLCIRGCLSGVEGGDQDAHRAVRKGVRGDADKRGGNRRVRAETGQPAKQTPCPKPGIGTISSRASRPLKD